MMRRRLLRQLAGGSLIAVPFVAVAWVASFTLLWWQIVVEFAVCALVVIVIYLGVELLDV